MPIRDIFMAIAVPCLWGFGFVIAKAGMEELPPLLINGLRWSLAGIILIWWVPIPKKLFKGYDIKGDSIQPNKFKGI